MQSWTLLIKDDYALRPAVVYADDIQYDTGYLSREVFLMINLYEKIQVEDTSGFLWWKKPVVRTKWKIIGSFCNCCHFYKNT